MGCAVGAFMEKKTIGRMIAELRKANGMTQQEVADRLHVSNKAVSRWERDESAPDLSLIPAVAEMFDITCDELLKGERMTDAPSPQNSEPKAEKPCKALLNRTVSGFKTQIWISIALSVVGLICMLGISYGFYRPVIGFAVMLLLEVAAFVIAVIAVNKMKEVNDDNELFRNIDPDLKRKFHSALGTFSFTAFFTELAAILLSLPLICFQSSYIFSVLGLNDYSIFVAMIALFLVLIFLVAREPYTAWLTGQSRSESAKNNPKVRLLNRMQLGAVALSVIAFWLAPFLEMYETSIAFIALNMIGLAFLLADIVCFIVFLCKFKSDRKALLLPGIRNLLLIPSGFAFSTIYAISFTGDQTGAWRKEIIWNPRDILFSLGLALLITVIFKIIDTVTKRQK